MALLIIDNNLIGRALAIFLLPYEEVHNNYNETAQFWNRLINWFDQLLKLYVWTCYWIFITQIPWPQLFSFVTTE